MDNSILGWYRAAVEHHRAGRVVRARPLYERILARAPDHAPTLHMLGRLRREEGETRQAVDLLTRAAQQRPGVAGYHHHLGCALEAAGDVERAEAAQRRALELRPDHADAAYRTARLLIGRGRTGEATNWLTRALDMRPDFARAATLLARIHGRAGHYGEAERCLRSLLERAPNDPDALFALGRLLRREGRVEEAIACFEVVVASRPRLASAYAELGILHGIEGELETALACFDRACALDPASASAAMGRGRILESLRCHEAARGAYERALALRPDAAVEAHVRLAVVRRRLCDWSEADLKRVTRRLERYLQGDGTGSPSPLGSDLPAIPAALRRAVAERRAGRLARVAEASRTRCAYAHPARDRDRLRVGYLSPDFRSRPVGALVHDLFRHHDRDTVEVYAYSLVAADDPFQRSVRSGVDLFRDVSRHAPGAIADRIHDDGVDVLVDLAGYEPGARTSILALRPAPIQAHWLGYPDTMGAAFTPYVIADRNAIPRTAQRHYSEALVALPDGFTPSSPLPIAGGARSRVREGLPANAVVLCGVAELSCIDPTTFDAWMRILRAAPEAVLWLPNAESGSAHERLREEAAARGIAAERLHFATPLPMERQLARHRLADLCLDPLGASDAAGLAAVLTSGVPALTRPGEGQAARAGASVLYAARLRELVLRDVDAYVHAAVGLARDPAQLSELRTRVAERASRAPLFDLRRFARHLEWAYRAMWSDHVSGVGPRDRDVPALDGRPAISTSRR
jgi:predicted O-linked N-acetylglucosamine transferase (SPINDLY family)